ncbi:zona pellucida sperm-binding protein 3-like [Mugil cephalus]|uniref:zona pellucida sperm-binding protein 3-like n=1 Tax=Mugil cephalus TaxID=48193 RepID=UPI001FB6FE0C|nr:zona pellucida sperm-binding protein 3-like [Mugil cephalus]
MVMKWSAACLVALALLVSICDAQWADYKSPPGYQKQGPPVRQEPTVPQGSQQQKQSFGKELVWTYPVPVPTAPPPEVPFEPIRPESVASVAVECRERDAHVEVRRDMFGTGQLIDPNDLTLGNCPVLAEDFSTQVLIFEAELHQCGSSLVLTEESLIYIFNLNYDPRPLGASPVVRTGRATVVIECHYPRKHNVSSPPLEPLWIPYAAVKVAEEFLYFSLKLMTDDWLYERPVNQYFLGDMVHLEAQVRQFFHTPLRVYVDRCVVSLSPDPNSTPRYAFIENYGCLVDARVTGSTSRFFPRTAENKLQFQLEAFRFKGSDSGLLYITCHLKATSTSYVLDTEHRACSYANGWSEASGVNGVCGSCDSGGADPSWGIGGGGIAQERKTRDVSKTDPTEWEADVTLGPISISDRPVA